MNLVKYAKDFSELLAELKARPIETQEDLDWAASWADKVAAALKHVEAKRKAAKEPYLEAGREVDARYKPVTKALEACEKELKAKVRALRDRQRDAEDKARALVRETGGEASADTLALAHGTGGLVLPETMRETSTLKWEVEDERKVPAEYKRTCAELVEAEIERTEGKCKIPGVRVWREFGVARKGVVKR